MEALARAMMLDSMITSSRAIENPEQMREIKMLEGKEDCYRNFPRCNVVGCRWRKSCLPETGRQ